MSWIGLKKLPKQLGYQSAYCFILTERSRPLN